MHFRKGFAVFAVMILSVAMVFAGGSGESAASDSKSVEVWRISNPDEKIIAAFDQVAADFQAATGIEVSYVLVPTNDFHTKLVTSISAGVYPDVIIWNSNPGIEFANTGKVHPVNDILEEVGMDQFGESIIKMFEVDDVIYEAPFMVRPAGMHARRDWLEAAGYDLTMKTDENGKYYIEGLETWEDLLEAGVKITDAANGKYGLGFAMSRKAFGDSAGFCFSVIASYGGRILDEEGNLDIDTPEMRAAIQYLIDVWNSGAVPSATTTWDGNSNNQFFLTGDIGIVCNSNSIMGKLNDESAVKPEQLIMLPLPKGPTGHGYQQATPESITIFETANVANAEEFVKYLLNTETQLKMFETMGFGYYSPLKKDVINDPMFADLSDNEKVLLNSGDQYISASFPGEPDARLTQLYSAFFYDDILSHIAVDGWNVDQIIDEMEKVASEMLFS